MSSREIMSLNGQWEIEESDSITVPEDYKHTLSVPGYVDQAVPAFHSTGISKQPRSFFWLKRKFVLTRDVPETALLKIYKAAYGYKVLINNREAGESFSCYTPTCFNVKDYLVKGENEIRIRLGAYINNIPDSIPNGRDGEKAYYISGVYDKIDLILTNTPFIENIQVVPIPEKGCVKVVSRLKTETDKAAQLTYSINESKSGRKVAGGTTDIKHINGTDTIIFETIIPDFKWWSPESPFLYRVTVSTEADELSTTFGMRTFHFDKTTGRAMLNGKPYYMRGTNLCYHRFSEDSLRKSLPWDTLWVNNLYQKIKDSYMNCLRNSLGFPPSLWYDVADEKGMLVQDEFPIWYSLSWPEKLHSPVLIREYTKWIEEHRNHPSIVLWDAQNESWMDTTQVVIEQVRKLDLSDRPWDNGCGEQNRETDALESHPYRFHRANYDEPPFFIEQLETETGQPDIPLLITRKDGTLWFEPTFIEGIHPYVVNEYGWLWLNRDGSTTQLTDKVYRSLLGEKSTTEERRYTYARNLAALTEFWRCNRYAAAVMHFCFLGHSRPGKPLGFTSDNFADPTTLMLESNFQKYVVDAFCPVGIMINKWDCHFRPGSIITIPLVIINDLPESWDGFVDFYLNPSNDKQSKQITLAPYEKKQISFELACPNEKGKYLLTSELVYKRDTISSLRDLYIK